MEGTEDTEDTENTEGTEKANKAEIPAAEKAACSVDCSARF